MYDDADCGHSPDLWDTCPIEYLTESDSEPADQPETIPLSLAINLLINWLRGHDPWREAGVEDVGEMYSRLLNDAAVTVHMDDDASHMVVYRKGVRIG